MVLSWSAAEDKVKAEMEFEAPPLRALITRPRRLWPAAVSHSHSFSAIPILVAVLQHVHRDGDQEGDLKVGGDAEVITGGEKDGVAV